MPAFEFPEDEPDADPLFPPEDPLTLTVSDIEGVRHVFNCTDKPRLPDDSSYGLDNRPRSYLLDSVAEQVVESQRRVAREVFDDLMKEGIVDETGVMEMLKWLGDQRNEARKARTKKKLRRPTTAQSASTS